MIQTLGTISVMSQKSCCSALQKNLQPMNHFSFTHILQTQSQWGFFSISTENSSNSEVEENICSFTIL